VKLMRSGPEHSPRAALALLFLSVPTALAQEEPQAAAAGAVVRVAVSAPASMVQGIDLRNESTRERVRLDAAGAGEWSGVVPWTGRTQAIAWGSMEFILDAFEVDERSKRVSLSLPDTRLEVRVESTMDSYPIEITAVWNDSERHALPAGGAWRGRVEGPDDAWAIEGLPLGTYRISAFPAPGSPRSRDGNFVALGSVELERLGRCVPRTLIDDSRWLSVSTRDGAGVPVAGIAVYAASQGVRELASGRTDAAGGCRVRVVGHGPFRVSAWSFDDGEAWLSDPFDVQTPDQEVLRFEMRRAAIVDVNFSDHRTSGAVPRLVRFTGLGSLSGKSTSCAPTEAHGWILPAYLEAGDWLVQALDADGRVLGEQPLHVPAPARQTVCIELGREPSRGTER
jgi:hypothetical protein